MSEQISFVIEQYDNKTLAEANEQFALMIVQLKAENDKLRELVRGLKYCAHEAYGMCARVPVGGERPFTCCPLYDFDAKKYRCEEFMLELGIEVPS